MNRSFQTSVEKPKDDLDLLHAVSRYHEVMSNPQLFAEVRNELNTKIAELGAKSVELDEKQARFTAETAEAVKRHEELLAEMKANVQAECEAKQAFALSEHHRLVQEANEQKQTAAKQCGDMHMAKVEELRQLQQDAEAKAKQLTDEALNLRAQSQAMMDDARAMMAKAMKAIEISNIVTG